MPFLKECRLEDNFILILASMRVTYITLSSELGISPYYITVFFLESIIISLIFSPCIYIQYLLVTTSNNFDSCNLLMCS